MAKTETQNLGDSPSRNRPITMCQAVCSVTLVVEHNMHLTTGFRCCRIGGEVHALYM